MELVKKKFLLATTTGATTGCTSCYVIIPDTGVTYSINFLLNQNMDDWGFFDTLSQSGTTGATFPIEVNVISGTSSSRLPELRKYSRSGSLENLFYVSIDPSVDGVDSGLTTTGITYTYYIGGITYVDDVTGETTTYTYASSGYSDTNNFVNLPYIKDESKQNIIDKPLIDNNVFIIREEQRVLDYNYRLRNIGNLTELRYYAGGGFYNIIENT